MERIPMLVLRDEDAHPALTAKQQEKNMINTPN